VGVILIFIHSVYYRLSTGAPVTDRLNTRMNTDLTAEAGRSNAARLAAIPQVDNDSGQRQRQTHHHDIRQEELTCTHRY